MPPTDVRSFGFAERVGDPFEPGERLGVEDPFELEGRFEEGEPTGSRRPDKSRVP